MSFIRLRLFIVLAICCIWSVSAHAQTIISGHVKDLQGEAVAGATVLLYSDSLLTPPMKGYAITRKDGSYSISPKSGGDMWVQAKCLGYKDRKVKARVMPESTDIVLEHDERSLSEIVVKGTYTGIKMAGDTVKFDTGHFSNGFENSVSDILEKLPGVSVSEGGNVSYGGKAVDKLLIDGRDLFTRESDGLVIKNMPADVVAGAEIIKNYKDGTPGSNYGRRDNTALNIKTKGLGRLSGYADASGGYKDKYNAKSFTLSAGNRLSLTAILSGNNTGTPVFSLNDYLSHMMSGGNVTASGQTSIKISGAETSLLYRPDNLCKDMNNMATLNAKYKASDRLEINGSLLFNHSDTHSRTERDETYLSADTLVRSASTTDNRGNFLTAKLAADWRPTDKAQLRWNIKVGMTDISLGTAATNSGTGGTKYDNTAKNNGRDIESNVSLNVSAGKGLLFVNGNFAWNDDKDRSMLTTNRRLLPVDYGTANNGGNDFYISQHRTTRRLSIGSEAGYSLNLMKCVSLNASVSQQHEQNTLRLTSEQTAGGEDKIQTDEYSANIFARNTKGALKVNAGASVTVERSTITGRQSENRIKVYPSLSLSYDFSNAHSLSLSLSRTKNRTETAKMSALTLIDSYNEMTAASAIDTPFQTGTSLSINYNNYNTASQTYLTVYANMQRQDHALTPVVSQEGTTSTVAYAYGSHADNIYAMANLEKRLSAIPLSIKINLTANYVESPSVLNGMDNTSTLKSLKAKAIVASNFRSMFNGEVSLGYSRRISDIASSRTKTDISGIDAGGKLYVKTGRLKFTASMAYSHSKTDTYRYDIYDLGLSAEYKIRRLTLKLSAENVLNLDSNSWINTLVTPYYSAIERYNRMPGCLMAGLKWTY